MSVTVYHYELLSVHVFLSIDRLLEISRIYTLLDNYNIGHYVTGVPIIIKHN